MSRTTSEIMAENRQHITYSERRITEWSEPPGSAAVHQGRRRTSYSALAWELRANPGQWARLEDRASTSAAYQFALSVARGARSAFRPAGAFDAAHDGRAVWVRYVGGDDMPTIPPDENEMYVDEDQTPIEAETGIVTPDPGSAFTF